MGHSCRAPRQRGPPIRSVGFDYFILINSGHGVWHSVPVAFRVAVDVSTEFKKGSNDTRRQHRNQVEAGVLALRFGAMLFWCNSQQGLDVYCDPTVLKATIRNRLEIILEGTR